MYCWEESISWLIWLFLYLAILNRKKKKGKRAREFENIIIFNKSFFLKQLGIPFYGTALTSSNIEAIFFHAILITKMPIMIDDIENVYKNVLAEIIAIRKNKKRPDTKDLPTQRKSLLKE